MFFLPARPRHAADVSCSTRSVATHSRRRSVILVALPMLIGCSDLAHSNPLDPDSNVQLTITGPASAGTLNRDVEFRVTASPALPAGTVPEWESSDRGVIVPAGAGKFRTVRDGTAMITAWLGPHAVTHRFTVQQVPATLKVTTTASATTASFTSFNETAQLTAAVFDSGGTRMAAASTAPPVTWSVVTGSAAVVAGSVGGSTATVTARANGSATVQATSGTLTGTFPVTVAQVPASLAFSQASYVISRVGATAQLGFVVRDRLGSQIPGATSVATTASTGGIVSIATSGMMTGLARGATSLTGRITTVSGATVSAFSSVTVQ
jgi:hypothetical protein